MPATDLNSHAVLEYAVGHLNIKEIIVAGHYGCWSVVCKWKLYLLWSAHRWASISQS